MGLWGTIKIALNSTLGTDEFQPLDKLIRGLYRRIVASDTEQLVIRDTEITYEEETSQESEPPVERRIDTITINADGVIRVRINAKARNGSAAVAIAMSDMAGNKIFVPALIEVPNNNTYDIYDFEFNVSRGMGTVTLDLLIKTEYIETSTYITYLSVDRVAVCYDEVAELPKAIL